MVKFLKRISIFIIVSFILFNTVAFLVLNSPIIQNAIVNYINLNYLKPNNLKLSLNSLSLSFFSAALNLNEVAIKGTPNNNVQASDFKLSLNQISLALDIPSSYLYRKPVVKMIFLRGLELHLNYDEHGKLILPQFSERSNDKNPIDLPKTLETIFSNLPHEFNILNANITLGEKDKPQYQTINLNLLELNKTEINDITGLNINANINGTQLVFPFLHADIKINDLNLKGILLQNGDLKISDLNLDSNIAKFKSKVDLNLKSKIEESNYEVDFAPLQVKAHNFFSLLNLKSDGNIFLSGKLKSQKLLYDLPFFTGAVRWEKLSLQQFSIYNGVTKAIFKEKIIYYNNAIINTPQNGKLYSEGKFELFGDFNFQNTARIETFSFAELLDGFGVSASPVDFNIKSSEIHVDGKIISKDTKKSFELYAKGQASASGMVVTTFNQSGRKHLPNFNMNLNLSANKLGLYFDKSYITLPKTDQNSKLSEVHVAKGGLDFTPAKGIGVDVVLSGSNIELSNAEYFLKLPTSGLADFNGSVTVTPPSTNILFQARTTAQNGEIVGIKFNRLDGNWGIDSQGIFANDINANIGKDVNRTAIVKVKKLRLNFADLWTSISTSASGYLNGLLSALPNWVPILFQNSDGVIQNLNAQLNGLLFHPSTWNLEASSKINKLKMLNGNIDSFDLLLSCKVGECGKSHLLLNSIYANMDELPAKTNSEIPSTKKGQVLFVMDQFSFKKSGFQTKIFQFPLSFFNVNSSFKLDGTLNSNISIYGSWDHIDGAAQARVTDLKINQAKLGDLTLFMTPDQNKKLTFELNAFNNQMKTILTIQQDQSSNSILNLTLNKFNATQLMTDSTRASYNLFSQLTGWFNFQGPFTTEIFNNPLKFLSNWNGFGRFSQGFFQFKNLILNLKESEKFTLANNKIQIPNTYFKSNILDMNINGNIDLNEKSLFVPMNITVDFANLQNAFPNIFDYSSSGSAISTILISGPWSQLNYDGNMSLSAKEIALKTYGPNLTDLIGLVNFKNRSIEIQRIMAHKGKGEVNVAGNIDYSQSSPNLRLRITTSKADIRAPIPIFLFTDMNIDSDIILSGRTKPYLIEGDVLFRKLQVIRDLDCTQITNEALHLPKKDQTIVADPLFNFNVNLKASNSIHIQSQCLRGRFSTLPYMNISGNDVSPDLNGTLSTDSATLQFLKTTFDIKRANIQFVPAQKYDPNVDIDMQGRVNTYNIYWKMNGRISQARLDLTADPPILPNGERIADADIYSMISTGQVPQQSSSTNIFAASTGVASFLGINNFFDTTLNDTVSTVTVGLVDNVSISPSSQNGQLSWRANASRSVSQRLNLGVTYEDGTGGSTRTAYANYMFNNTVSAISSFNATNFVQQNPRTEFYSGLRFQFGSQ